MHKSKNENKIKNLGTDKKSCSVKKYLVVGVVLSSFIPIVSNAVATLSATTPVSHEHHYTFASIKASMKSRLKSLFGYAGKPAISSVATGNPLTADLGGLAVYKKRISLIGNTAIAENPPIAAFSDYNCGVKGMLSVYAASQSEVDQEVMWGPIAPCISNGEVTQVVLKNNWNNLYIAYAEGNMIKLKIKEYGNTGFTDYPNFPQINTQQLQNLNLVVSEGDEDGAPAPMPVVTYIDKGVLYVIKYSEVDSTFKKYPFALNSLSGSPIYTGLDTHGNINIAYLDENGCPGFLRFSVNNTWSFIRNKPGDTFHDWVKGQNGTFDAVFKSYRNGSAQGENKISDMNYVYFALAQENKSNGGGISKVTIWRIDLDQTQYINQLRTINDSGNSSIADFKLNVAGLDTAGINHLYFSYMQKHGLCEVEDGEGFCIRWSYKYYPTLVTWPTNQDTNNGSETRNTQSAWGKVELLVNPDSWPPFYVKNNKFGYMGKFVPEPKLPDTSLFTMKIANTSLIK